MLGVEGWILRCTLRLWYTHPVWFPPLEYGKKLWMRYHPHDYLVNSWLIVNHRDIILSGCSLIRWVLRKGTEIFLEKEIFLLTLEKTDTMSSTATAPRNWILSTTSELRGGTWAPVEITAAANVLMPYWWDPEQSTQITCF